MLIYNYKKEFLGIDENDLRNLGFSDLAQLRAESADFADLFVRTPGYIHNFKHVHWIDFIECADSSEDSKVIIHAKNKNYKCTLAINTVYLLDNPSAKAYLIHLQNIKELTKQESEQIAGDLQERPTPKMAISSVSIFNTPEFNDDFQETNYEAAKTTALVSDSYKHYNDSNIVINNIEDTYEEAIPPVVSLKQEVAQASDTKKRDDVIEKQEDDYLRLDLDDVHSEDEKESFEHDEIELENDTPDNGYVYDPHVASDELGLPVDLIEEFIQDFISQAKEFKEDLYYSLSKGEMDNVKIQSHKLKGVAANLRIEDAFEVLTIINTSSDEEEIQSNLNRFYRIVSKLAGEKIQPITAVSVLAQKTEIIEEDSTFKDEDDEDLYMDQKIDIDDSEVPDKIEMAELADDEFLNHKEIADTDDEPDLSLLDEMEDDNDLFADIAELEELSDTALFNFKYNKDLAASEIGIDKESFNELLQDYIHETNALCTAIHKAIDEDDYNSWKNNSMKIKGMSESMNIHEFTPELETLLETKDAKMAAIAINKIDAFISYIKNEGV